MTSADYLALLLADARLPTGAHTQSAGVEPALRHGMHPDQVPDYLRARLRTVTETEAATSVVARHAWLRAAAADRDRALAQVDRAWRTRTLSDALRDASDLLGRGYLRTTGAIWDLGLTRDRPWCRGVVIGAAAAAAGLDAAAVARVLGYEDVQTVVAATLKLAPFDPVRGARWVVDAGPDVDAMVERVVGITSTVDIPAHAASLMEVWAQAHVTEERRLFRA